jgi:cytochrome b561
MSRGYDRGSRLFHWLVTVLVCITVPIGIAMTSEGFDGWRDAFFVTHKALGIVILVVVLLRGAWRILHPAPPLPEAIPEAERRLARAGHRLLYLLLVGMAVVGYARTAGGGYPVEILDVMGIGPLVPEMHGIADALSVVHKFGAWLLVAVIAVHVALVLQHTFFGKTPILPRMWPPWGTKRYP